MLQGSRVLHSSPGHDVLALYSPSPVFHGPMFRGFSWAYVAVCIVPRILFMKIICLKQYVFKVLQYVLRIQALGFRCSKRITYKYSHDLIFQCACFPGYYFPSSYVQGLLCPEFNALKFHVIRTQCSEDCMFSESMLSGSYVLEILCPQVWCSQDLILAGSVFSGLYVLKVGYSQFTYSENPIFHRFCVLWAISLFLFVSVIIRALHPPGPVFQGLMFPRTCVLGLHVFRGLFYQNIVSSGFYVLRCHIFSGHYILGCTFSGSILWGPYCVQVPSSSHLHQVLWFCVLRTLFSQVSVFGDVRPVLQHHQCCVLRGSCWF